MNCFCFAGLVPRCCEELFKTVESQRSKDVVFEVIIFNFVESM